MSMQFPKGSGVALAAALMTLAAGSAAQAQERIVASVPFAFVVGDSVLPAGKYDVKPASDSLGVWKITSNDGRYSAVMLTIPAASSQEPATPELVFDKFENQYFLARIVAYDDQREIALTPARMEHEVIKLALK